MPTPGNSDVFVTKLDTNGGQIWNTFLGSSVYDWAQVIAVDASDNVYVGGESMATWSTPEDPHIGAYDVFAAGLDSSGVLQWNTFMGSSSYEFCSGIAVDSSDNVYVAGSGWANWGTPLIPHTGDGSNDAFAVMLGSDSSTIGDVNSDGIVDLTDVITTLQVLTGIIPPEVYKAADINNDGEIGLAEAIFALRYDQFTISSSSFTDNGTIPLKHTLYGDNISPQLSWENAPNGTEYFSILMEDIDAASPNGGFWLHWKVTLPKTTTSLAENAGIAPGTNYPDGAVARYNNDFYGRGVPGAEGTDYDGPRPPAGSGVHHYHFIVTALDSTSTPIESVTMIGIYEQP
jgi:Raf kinase inhibitor-like YbhB/YbcL family protein